MHDIVFSDAQALTTLDSTGEVSDNVFDMELDGSGGNTILTDDQVVGVLNITIPPLAGQIAGDEGMDIQLLSNDNADMTTGTEVELGIAHASQAELQAGCVKNIEVTKAMTQKFLGVWYKATSTTLTTGQTVDAHWSIAPLTENDKLQKVPSRS
jgi:hypothetical protein